MLETLALPAMVVPVEYPMERDTTDNDRNGSQDRLVTRERRMSSNGRLLNSSENNKDECACSRLE